jgi:hypothetical protein
MFQRKEHKTEAGAIVPGGVFFSRVEAIHWLQQIAKRMTKQQVTTLYLERLNPNWVKSRWKYVVTVVLAYGFVYGLLFGVLFGLIDTLSKGPIHGLINAMIGGILGSILGLIFEFLGMVQLVEAVRFHFDWRKLLRGLNRGLLFGGIGALFGALCFGLIGALIGQLRHALMHALSIGLIVGLILGLFTGLITGLMYGLIVGLIEMRSYPEPVKPNQGIRNSARTSLLGGMTLALLIGGAGAMAFGEAGWKQSGFYFGSVLFGGGAVMRHYSIRLTLAWEGMLRFPLNDRRLVAFLDAMCDRILLTRIGGGWIFIHPLLFEFLAGEPFGTNPGEVATTLSTIPPKEKSGE